MSDEKLMTRAEWAELDRAERIASDCAELAHPPMALAGWELELINGTITHDAVACRCGLYRWTPERTR